jgi:hypothetical protein
MNTKEIWLNVPGFEDAYEVSNYGRLRSKTRVRANSAKGTRTIQGQIITPHKRKDGYLTVRIALHGVKTSTYIHKLVALAFHGYPEKGQEVLHKNGIKTDNRAENVHWGTRVENIADNKRHGIAPIGENHGRAKLTEDEVLAIRADPRSRHADVAADFSVSRATVRLIKQRKIWVHL